VNFFSFFFPQKIAQINSPTNGRIEVIEQFGEKSIRVQNLEQSGSMVEKIWEEGLKTLHATCYMLNAPKILILGLGGGSAAKIINKYFPRAKILGIEIDPAMVKLGREYLNLSKYENLKIKIADVFKWLRAQKLNGSNHFTQYDLILVDLFLGRKLPEEIESKEFLSKIKKLLTNEGIVIFNRLRSRDKEVEFQKFLEQLKKVYHQLKVIKPIANYLVICQ